ncbi:DNA repair protein xrcc2 [Trebouxia sp. C0009 RCD-2024]
MAEYAAFLEPDETAYDLFARIVVDPVRTGVPFLDRAVFLRPGHVVELVGASGCGKSEVLVQAAATCILPKEVNGVVYNGRQENSLLIDLDSKFDLLRLIQVLDFKIKTAQQAQHRSGHADSTVLTECLHRFHLIQCHSSFQFLAALKVIKPTLTSLENNGGLRLLLIDNVAAFYWLDKDCKGQQVSMNLQTVHAVVAHELRTIMQHHKLAVLATKHAVLAAPSQGGGGPPLWVHREFLPQAWHELVSHRVMLRCVQGQPSHLRKPPGKTVAYHFQAKSVDTGDTEAHASFAVIDGALVMC